MRSSYSRQNNSKIIISAVLIAILLGIIAIVVQDIEVPSEHISQEISVNLEK